MKKLPPDYGKIYSDLIDVKYPEKKAEYLFFLQKKRYSALDIINFNTLLFKKNDRAVFVFNQKHRFYDKKTILEILNYQKENRLNNMETARHFKISRNSLSKWKKIFWPNKQQKANPPI
ncbi:transposase [Chryseobacterium sp. T16E-39]|uniref:transposase n=1 Tax=Chryseobacterium sp. T16E-39 TaxID=2015076 RepID=UPI000B5B4595|nr:transposase [Chryseobacterium sp. T16E-39]ASK32849.1 transposase [Chryseobacterium sp. T16E-39]